MRGMKRKLIWAAVVVTILMMGMLIVRQVTRPDFKELLTSINDIRATIPLAVDHPDLYTLQRGRLTGLFDRNEPRLNRWQSKLVQDCRLALYKYELAVTVVQYGERVGMKRGVLGEPKFEKLLTEHRSKLEIAAENCREKLKELESALE